MAIDPTVQDAIDALAAAAAAEEAIDEQTIAGHLATIATLTTERDTLQLEIEGEVAFLTTQRDALDARITALGG